MERREGRIVPLQTPTKAKTAAIRLATQAGARLAEMCPEIAASYRDGVTVRELANRYAGQILDDYPLLSERVRRRAVEFTLKLLLGRTERSILRESHERAFGELSRNHGLGFFGMAPEARQAARKKGIKTQMQEGKGLFGFDDEKRHAIGVHRAILQGKAPISDEEGIRLVQLCEDPNFQHQRGSNKRKPDYRSIRGQLVEEGYPRRTMNALRSIFYDVRKDQRKRIDQEEKAEWETSRH